MAYYDLKRSGAQFMFNLRGDKHETVLTSERYVTKQGALNGIGSVRVHSPFDANYRRLTSTSNQPYFVLKANNNEVLGTSETYSSASARDVGIEWVKKNGPSAPVQDNT